MKKRQLIRLWAVLLGVLLSATYVSAQEPVTVEIKNNSNEKRKICMYKDTDLVRAVPYKCFVIDSGAKVRWKRTEGALTFVVKVFKPQLIDKRLFYQRLPFDTTVIEIETGGIRFYVQPNLPRKFTLKVCNQRFSQEIYFALGFETGKTLVTEGWWSVTKGKCVDIAVSESLKRTWNVDYGPRPKIFFYAESKGDRPLYWRGGPSDHNLCINNRRAFNKKQRELTQGSYVPTDCTAEDEKLVRFRLLEKPNLKNDYTYLTF